MDEITFWLSIFRGAERWMIVLGGVFFGYLGYKLFLYGVDQGHGKLNAENQFLKITFSGSGPGLFFMAFGALVLMISVYSPLESNRKETIGDSNSSQVASAAVERNLLAATKSPTTVETSHKYNSNLGAEVCDRIPSSGDGEKALDSYRRNKIPQLVVIADALEELGALKDSRREALNELIPKIYTVICE
jgi:hypothetical protein